jgi:hypothetical protein
LVAAQTARDVFNALQMPNCGVRNFKKTQDIPDREQEKRRQPAASRRPEMAANCLAAK